MKAFPLLLALSLFLPPAQAQDQAQDPTCTCNPQDPYDPQARMPRGPFQGRCLNSCQQRSIQILSQTGSRLTLANVSHQQQFWIAEIDLTGLDSVIYQTEELGGASCPACHSQLRFRFRPGSEVRLTPQTPDQQDPILLRDLVYSVEATTIPLGGFDPIAGLFDIFALAYRFVSLPDRATVMIQESGHRVTQTRLALTLAQQQTLLELAARQSDRNGLRQMYDTLQKNCTTELFEILYQATDTPFLSPQLLNIPSGSQVNTLISNNQLSLLALESLTAIAQQDWLQPFLSQGLPIPDQALRQQGWIDATSTLPDLNQELGL